MNLAFGLFALRHGLSLNLPSGIARILSPHQHVRNQGKMNRERAMMSDLLNPLEDRGVATNYYTRQTPGSLPAQ